MAMFQTVCPLFQIAAANFVIFSLEKVTVLSFGCPELILNWLGVREGSSSQKQA